MVAFCSAKRDNSVWHAQSEAWAWELWQMFLAIHHALRKLRDVPHDGGDVPHDGVQLANKFTT